MVGQVYAVEQGNGGRDCQQAGEGTGVIPAAMKDHLSYAYHFPLRLGFPTSTCIHSSISSSSSVLASCITRFE